MRRRTVLLAGVSLSRFGSRQILCRTRTSSTTPRSSWSSGAHLAACAIMTDWTRRGLPADAGKGGFLMSGMHVENILPLALDL
jgi:hypothetical protein